MRSLDKRTEAVNWQRVINALQLLGALHCCNAEHCLGLQALRFRTSDEIMEYVTTFSRKGLARENAHFGWEMSEKFRAQLTEATKRQGEFKSKHHYTLEEFGMTKEWIQEELGSLLDHYSLPR